MRRGERGRSRSTSPLWTKPLGTVTQQRAGGRTRDVRRSYWVRWSERERERHKRGTTDAVGVAGALCEREREYMKKREGAGTF